MGKNGKEVFVAVDLGSSKLSVMAAERGDTGLLQILGSESIPMPKDAVRYGIVRKANVLATNLKALIEQLQRSINQKGKEKEKNYEIKSFYVGVDGNTLRPQKRLGMKEFTKKIVLTQPSLDEFLENAKKGWMNQKNLFSDGNVPESYSLDTARFAHAFFPQSFVVDGVRCEQPLGNMAKTLKVEYLAVESQMAVFEGLRALAAELKDSCSPRKRLSAVSLGEAFLTADERKQGAVLIDFGAQCTSIVVYENGVVRYVGCVPLGGDNITRDLAVMSSLNEQDAEALKRSDGDVVVASKSMSFGSFAEGKSHLSKRDVAKIVRARQLEILDFVEQHIEKAGCSDVLKRCVAITGGASRMTNLQALLQNEKQWAVRTVDFANRFENADETLLRPENAVLLSLLLNATENCCELEKKTQKTTDSNKKNRFLEGLFEMFEDE